MFDDFLEDEEGPQPDDEVAPDAEASLPPPRENPDLIGHAQIEESLLSLYNTDRLPHAMIFAGPMGVGKATAAFRLARFLLKNGAADDTQDSLFGGPPEKPTTLSVAPDDPVFRKVASGGHPDLRFFERPLDEKKGTRKGAVDIDSVRKIAPFLRMSASDGGWRVVIVDEADLMKREAQNALLKILEEPPSKALLILICNRPGALIPTIRSRCRMIHFSPLEEGDMAPLLKRAAPDISASDLSVLAALSGGSPGRALYLHEEEGINSLNILLGFFEDWPRLDWVKIHQFADTLARNGAERSYSGFAFVTEWLAQELLRARAVSGHALPKGLDAQSLEKIVNHYSLEQWIEICEKLKDHFAAIETGNLDKRHGVIGAFAILAG